MSSKVINKSIVTITSVATLLLAVVAFFGFNGLKDYKDAYESSKKKLDADQLEIEKKSHELETSLDQAKKLAESYSGSYNEYIKTLFTSYSSSLERLIEDAAKVKTLEADYTKDIENLRASILELEVLKEKNDTQISELQNQNQTFQASLQSEIESSDLAQVALLDKLKEDINAREYIVLSRRTKRMVSRIANVVVSYKDDPRNRNDRVKSISVKSVTRGTNQRYEVYKKFSNVTTQQENTFKSQGKEFRIVLINNDASLKKFGDNATIYIEKIRDLEPIEE